MQPSGERWVMCGGDERRWRSRVASGGWYVVVTSGGPHDNNQPCWCWMLVFISDITLLCDRWYDTIDDDAIRSTMIRCDAMILEIGMRSMITIRIDDDAIQYESMIVRYDTSRWWFDRWCVLLLMIRCVRWYDDGAINDTMRSIMVWWDRNGRKEITMNS